MFSVRLGDALENRLAKISKDTKKTKSFYMKKAIKVYLEDHEDYWRAMHILDKDEPTYSLQDVCKELGIAL